jgi:hypothetical protein
MMNLNFNLKLALEGTRKILFNMRLYDFFAITDTNSKMTMNVAVCLVIKATNCMCLNTEQSNVSLRHVTELETDAVVLLTTASRDLWGRGTATFHCFCSFRFVSSCHKINHGVSSA